MTLAEITQAEHERQLFRQVFQSEEGQWVLTWIGNECRAWSQYPDQVHPDLLAFWNRLLGMLGVVHPRNLLEVVRGLSSAANDNDLMHERKAYAVPPSPSSQGTGRSPGGSADAAADGPLYPADE